MPIILACLLTLLIVGEGISSVYATNVKIIQVNYPQNVTYESSGTVSISAQVTVAFDNAPEKDGQYPGAYGVVAVLLYDVDTNSRIIGSDVIATSTPVPCKQGYSSGTYGTPETYCAFGSWNPSPITVQVVSGTPEFSGMALVVAVAFTLSLCLLRRKKNLLAG